MNRKDLALVLGECKWTAGRMSRGQVRELIEQKTPKVLQDLADAGTEGWTVHYAFFARAGFTDAARSFAADHDALLIAPDELERGLGGWKGE